MSARWHLRLAAVATSIGLGAVACSEGSVLGEVMSDDEDAAAPPPLPGEDASAPDVEDAGSGDGGTGDPDADVADAAKTCTDEGWCHVVVPDDQTLRALWGDGQGTVWTVSDEGNILRWNGTAWVQSYAAGVPLTTIWGSGPTDLWAGGGVTSTGGALEPGVLLHGTGPSPSAITWTKVATEVNVRSIWGSSATDVYAVTSVPHRVEAADPSYLLHYAGEPTDGSSGWTVDPLSTELPAHFDRVWGTSADDVWVSGRFRFSAAMVRGKVAHRLPDGEGGHRWRTDEPAQTHSSETRSETIGFSVSPTHAYLIGFIGNAGGEGNLHTGVSPGGDAPFTWTQTVTSGTGPSTRSLATAWGFSPTEIWFAGEYGRLRRWNGQTWRIANVSLDGLPLQQAIYAIWGSGPGDIWAVGAGLALHKVTQ
ncbi:MAG: hypothetical protein KF894_16685 [Labilithrix sp.]|nr:hypothetical protein [Labilithrix sp.]